MSRTCRAYQHLPVTETVSFLLLTLRLTAHCCQVVVHLRIDQVTQIEVGAINVFWPVPLKPIARAINTSHRDHTSTNTLLKTNGIKKMLNLLFSLFYPDRPIVK